MRKLYTLALILITTLLANYAMANTVGTPIFTPDGGEYNISVVVTITCETDGATIYYTIDGNDPSAESTLYEGPFTLNTTTTVKAIAIMEGMDNSEIAEATFTRAQYDFSAICSSGQTLFYYITSNEEPYTVEVVSENDWQPWYNTEPTGDLEIPESVEYNSVTYSVTSLGDYAFAHCFGLTAVTIPTSVTEIGSQAFVNCSGLTEPLYNATCFAYFPENYATSYAIPEGIQKIAGGAFSFCSGLAEITIPNSVTSIGSGAFLGCSGLTEITIPEPITYIGSQAFEGCSSLSTINFNATNCTTMGELTSPVFGDCTSLESLNIGEKVKIIPEYAFYDCSTLTEVTIPDSITSIGNLAFGYCRALQTLNFNARNCTIMGGEHGSALFASPVSTVNFGENVKIIPEIAFLDCTELTEMRLPDSLVNIGTQAFTGCSGLTGTLIIPDSVQFIGNAAFARCSGLTGDLVLPNSVKIIRMYAFSNCGGITSVTLGNSIDTLGFEAFYNCDSITDIYSLSITPPFLGPNFVSNALYQTVNVWIPCATIDSYRSANQWNRFANIRSEQTTHYNIEVETDDASMGDVTGSGSFTCDTEVVLVATPNDGYRFLTWNDGNEDNPRTIVVAGDSTFTASFRAIKTITATADEGGTIAPSGEVSVDEGEDQTFSITPNEHYRIASVLVDDLDVTADLIDGVYTFLNVTANHTIEATFEEIPTYTITVLANNEAYGSVSGGGTYNEGSTVTLTAMPYEGYTFVSWNDGDELNPRTIVVTSDSTFIADFAKCKITYAIDTVVNNFVTVGDHTFYSTGNYMFAIPHEAACDTIYDIHLHVLVEPVYDIGPNPTKSLLYINSDGFISAVEFYSTTGQLAMRKEVNDNKIECDVKSLVNGIYILRIYGEGNSLPSVYKVVKE